MTRAKDMLRLKKKLYGAGYREPPRCSHTLDMFEEDGMARKGPELYMADAHAEGSCSTCIGAPHYQVLVVRSPSGLVIRLCRRCIESISKKGRLP